MVCILSSNMLSVPEFVSKLSFQFLFHILAIKRLKSRMEHLGSTLAHTLGTNSPMMFFINSEANETIYNILKDNCVAMIMSKCLSYKIQLSNLSVSILNKYSCFVIKYLL